MQGPEQRNLAMTKYNSVNTSKKLVQYRTREQVHSIKPSHQRARWICYLLPPLIESSTRLTSASILTSSICKPIFVINITVSCSLIPHQCDSLPREQHKLHFRRLFSIYSYTSYIWTKVSHITSSCLFLANWFLA